MAVWWSRQDNKARRKRVLIVGAGEAGALLLRDIQRRGSRDFEVVGFVDDDDAKHGKHVGGAEVLGGTRTICGLVSSLQVDEIFVALPAAGLDTIGRILKECEKSLVPIRIVPSSASFSGLVDVRTARPVEIEDLIRGFAQPALGRNDLASVFAGRVVMVTGAAGSIGSQLSREIAKYEPAGLVLLDNRESGLFSLHHDFKQSFEEMPAIEVAIADIRDEHRVQKLFQRYHPEFVFHAAAYKHVPMMEFAADEAVKTNVAGTGVLLKAARESGASRFTFISTDKAVSPTSVMGATKKVAEHMVLAAGKNSDFRCTVVRFGNVFESEGSVVPLFRDQIRRGGPVTVTHPEATRYFIPVSEATYLLLKAQVVGEGGELFVLEMKEPVRILDLAKKMITLSGLKIGEDIKIEFTGLRPGEKLHENFFLGTQSLTETGTDRILRVDPVEPAPASFDAELQLLISRACEGDLAGVNSALSKLVPDFGNGRRLRGEEEAAAYGSTADVSLGSPPSFGLTTNNGSELGQIRECREDVVLLTLLKAGLNRLDQETLADLFSVKIDWDMMMRKANLNKLVSFLYYHIKPYLREIGIPDHVADKLQSSYYGSAVLNEHLRANVLDLIAGLKKEKVDCLLFKGALLSSLVYDFNPSRCAGDIDILVRKDQLSAAERVAEGVGFKSSNQSKSIRNLYRLHHQHLAPFQKTQYGVTVWLDVHHRLLSLSRVLGFSDEDLWEQVRQVEVCGTKVLSLNYEHMILYLCAHGLFAEGKITLSHVLDISLVIEKYGDQIDWGYFEKILEQSAARNAIRASLNIVKDLSGAPIPDHITGRERVSWFERRLTKAVEEGLLDPAFKIPGPVVQLLFLRGFDKMHLARKLLFPHPLHQVDGTTGSPARLRHGLNMARLYLTAIVNVARAKHTK